MSEQSDFEPIESSGFDADYATARDRCGLLDRSERGKLALSGADAQEFLNGQVTNDIVSLTPGSGAYAAFLTPKGKMLGDLRVLRTDTELLLDTERVALQSLFDMVRRYSLGYNVTLHKRTLETGLISLLGPESEAVLERAETAVPPPGEHNHLTSTIAGHPVRVVRTDLGFDVLTDAAATATVSAELLGAGAIAIAPAAADCLRIESGRPRFGTDLDDSVIPQEAGLNARAVCFTKGCYVGQETVARLFYKGKPNRQLHGLRAAAPLLSGDGLSFDGRDVGTITSATISPRLGPIGLALVRREAPVGSLVTDARGSIVEVVELPFR